MKGCLFGLFLTFAMLVLGQCYDDVIDVNVEGEFEWNLLFHIDNRGNQNEFKETRTYTKTTTTSYSRMTDEVVKQSVKVGYDIKADAVIEIVNVAFEASINAEIDRSYQETINYKKEDTVTEELTREFTVGANSEAYLYQLVYRGPGVTVQTDTISTDTPPMDKVIIKCKVKKVKMLEMIKVWVNTNPPADNPITEYFGGSTDTNAGQGGLFVYLSSVWTDSKDTAITGVQVVLEDKFCDYSDDLAAGAGGKYRCLIFLHEQNVDTRIQKIQLVRSAKYIKDKTELGFNGCSGDINEGRGGDNLNLCWVNVRV